MPVLNLQIAPAIEASAIRRGARTFPACANPRCASGWLHLWRKRRVPVVESGWLCSPACTRARVGDLLRREMAEANPATAHRHRIPIGLVLLTQGWITHDELRQALESQRAGSPMRLGEWLVANRGLNESRLAQALGIQWSCPVFSLEKHSDAFPVTVVPRLLSEGFGFVPLRLTASGVLYLAFEDRIDHSIALAVERITRLRVESGLLGASEFRQAQERALQSHFPRARMIEAGSLDLLADAFTKHIEREKPGESRLVRIRNLFWLRLWSRPDTPGLVQGGGVEDAIGSVVQFG
ncbi:MAG: hypothetical protein WAM66_11385 [Acidobacteriaceae bacterium]